MKNHIQSEQEEIQLAQTTTDSKILKYLSNSVHLSVRRCVARNTYTDVETIDKLSIDCSLNVSFIANKNSKSTYKRVITSTHPCIICTVDEKDYHKVCNNCTLLDNL